MKHTKPLNPLILGICFICKNPCNPQAYAHQECCLSASAIKELSIANSKIQDLKVILEEKQKILEAQYNKEKKTWEEKDKLLYPKPSKKPL